MHSEECFICTKHKNLSACTGAAIAGAASSMLLTHFPIIDGVLPARGHLLIEPPRHICDLSQMNHAETKVFGELVAKGSQLIKECLGAEHVYLFRINDKVAHLHFHLVPRFAHTAKDFWGLKIMEWPDSAKINLNEIKTLSQTLATAYKGHRL